jgi:hypothetical protein
MKFLGFDEVAVHSERPHPARAVRRKPDVVLSITNKDIIRP